VRPTPVREQCATRLAECVVVSGIRIIVIHIRIHIIIIHIVIIHIRISCGVAAARDSSRARRQRGIFVSRALIVARAARRH
jgi:hypothetical protein